MKSVITALLNQLKNHPTLSYAFQSAYIAEDPYELMEKDRFPFFNVVPGDERIEVGVDNTSNLEFERHIYPVTVQYATRSMNLNIAIMGDDAKNKIGILDFSNDIWSVIRFDITLNGVVEGLVPSTTSISKDFLQGEDKMFTAIAEIKIEFYKDFGLL